MKKHLFSFFLAVLLILSLTVPAIAASRAVSSYPTLTIKNGVAYCQGKCNTGTSNDKVSLVLTLMQGSTVVYTWTADWLGIVIISENCPVKSGKTYTLVLAVKINGKAMADKSVSANS